MPRPADGTVLTCDQDTYTRMVPRMSVIELAAGFPPTECVPPPDLEVLDLMADSTPDDITLGELYRALSAIRGDIEKGLGSIRGEVHTAVDALRAEMRSEIGDVKSSLGRVVYVDVFTAEQRVIAEREGAMRTELHSMRTEVRTARTVAWSCLFLLVSSIVGAIVVAVVAAVR